MEPASDAAVTPALPGRFPWPHMQHADNREAPDVVRQPLRSHLPSDWQAVLEAELGEPWFGALEAFLDSERAGHLVFPSEGDVFAAFRATPFADVRVVILGQDPYHDEGQAHGLAFSVPPGTALPPSLRNIMRELRDDLGFEAAGHGCLTPWATQGVLLLNAVLTVRAHAPNSHRNRGWEQVTQAVIHHLSARRRPVAFVLWGSFAQRLGRSIDTARHGVVASVHPSPLSARRGFLGSRPFSKVNALLRSWGCAPIDWRLPPMAAGADALAPPLGESPQQRMGE